jgi:hypothetical protein
MRRCTSSLRRKKTSNATGWVPLRCVEMERKGQRGGVPPRCIEKQTNKIARRWVPPRCVEKKTNNTMRRWLPPRCVEKQINNTARRWVPPRCVENGKYGTTRRYAPPRSIEIRKTTQRGGIHLLVASNPPKRVKGRLKPPRVALPRQQQKSGYKNVPASWSILVLGGGRW